jgi:RNA polymerase sigma-70 factor (ECF subfamily)
MPESSPGDSPQSGAAAVPPPTFDALYETHFDFVFRTIHRLGVAPGIVDDAVQDVFLVVLKHLAKFRPGTSEKAWLFAISVRVASDYRRTASRKTPWVSIDDVAPPAGDDNPFAGAARSQASAFVRDFLDALPEDKRDVFMLAELEEMSAPEISNVLGVNVNTVYTRLRAARRDFAIAARRLDPGGRGSHD